MAQLSTTTAAQEQAGSIRGIVYDKDFEAPLPLTQVLLLETGVTTNTSDQGNYLLAQLEPGRYTLVFSKDGYVRQIQSDVVVSAGRLTEVDAWLAGEFVDMEEFVVRDIVQLAAGTEAALLELRFDSPALMDSIGKDLMSKAGASDAASALKLVSGASVQDGKYAVIRGLPDRYVSSQMNGVRLPTADEDKRAVELDQFPTAVIESIQVSKTFTPDQYGDASGGAVNVRLRSIPEEAVFQVKAQTSYNSEVTGRSDFLTYDGGGVGLWGQDDGGRGVQANNLGTSWDGAAGVERGDAPIDFKLGLDAGNKWQLGDGVKLGAFTSLFYERDSSTQKGVDDSWWVANPGEPLTPQTYQGAPEPNGGGNFNTALLDVESSTESVSWGGMGTVGLETDNHSVALTYLYTHIAEDTATLAEDTRGKEYFYPGYDPNDPTAPGNVTIDRFAAPYIRTETLQYTERTTSTLQLSGSHSLPGEGFSFGDTFSFGAPRLDWTAARSFANSDQPDKRQFGSTFLPESFDPVSGDTSSSLWVPYKPAENFTVGNFQRIYKKIEEDSDQGSLNLNWPFQQWGEEEGYVRVGAFRDQVERAFDQDTFSNFSDVGAQFDGDFDDFWSGSFPFEDHPITASDFDVDYVGDQEITALYAMMDMPLSARLSTIGGARFESTDISVVNDPEAFATWFPQGATAPQGLEPGEADVDFSQDDVLPSIGLVYEATDEITVRASYSETVARQTFKELTPILQQEFLGGPIFIGNPELQMSALENYDLRVDYVPYEGSLVSLSWFRKDIEDPIEYVQRLAGFTFTTAANYPVGRLSGLEFETRQHLGRFWDRMDGLSVGANATFIDSKVTLPADEAEAFDALGVPMSSRDMTGAPEYLYNLYLTYDLDRQGTQLSAFYTVQGDTLVAGAGESVNNFVPSVYAKEYGTLNLSLSRRIGDHFRLHLQAKNLTDPEIEEVYRSDFTGGDVTRTSYTRGREYSLTLSANL